MKIHRQRMTVEEYHLLPLHPGWKVEYLRGEAVFRPREAVAFATMPLASRAVPRVEGIELREPGSAAVDGTGLIALFQAAFTDSPEYAGWPRALFRREGQRVVEDFLMSRRGRALPASRVAVVSGEEGKPVGAAFVVEQDGTSALLDVLMVAPAWQRRGVGTALVASAVTALTGAGRQRLVSSWHLAADPSADWHRKFGFVEEPDWMNAQLYARVAKHELWRLEQLGEVAPERRERLERERECWKNEVARLEALLAAGDDAGAFAHRRFPRPPG